MPASQPVLPVVQRPAGERRGDGHGSTAGPRGSLGVGAFSMCLCLSLTHLRPLRARPLGAPAATGLVDPCGREREKRLKPAPDLVTPSGLAWRLELSGFDLSRTRETFHYYCSPPESPLLVETISSSSAAEPQNAQKGSPISLHPCTMSHLKHPQGSGSHLPNHTTRAPHPSNAQDDRSSDCLSSLSVPCKPDLPDRALPPRSAPKMC